MLKHGNIRNQHTQISEKKTKNKFSMYSPYHFFSVTKTTHNRPTEGLHA